MSSVDPRRIFTVNTSSYMGGPIVYWMHRDKRVEDNWALIHAQELAIKKKKPLHVYFSLNGNFFDANIRQYGFMLRGLEETANFLNKKNIPFFIVDGKAETSIFNFCIKNNTGFIITDFSPLRAYRNRTKNVFNKLNIPSSIVDAHNIVPIWTASNKQEFAAYTIRPKINSVLNEFLTDFPKIKNHVYNSKSSLIKINFQQIFEKLNIDKSVKEIDWLVPGEGAAKLELKKFTTKTFSDHAMLRNNPNESKLSNMSPYLHYGQISAQRIAIEINALDSKEDCEAYLEQLIIRKELSDNFCYYNENYDSFNGFPKWAKSTLIEHELDEREFIYTPDQFENSKTHSPLWNAAQNQMVCSGKMHGYMRMYWAKKIMEWSPNIHSALQVAINLNDKYELDGRDPNGYTGIAWSMGGVHDRAWFERPIFGKIRYMNFNGCKRKFDTNKYILSNTINAQNA